MVMRRKFGLLVGAIALVAVVSASSATVYAVSSVDTRCDAFIDEDGDGICYNCGNGVGFVDEDGDGICDFCGNGTGFVDEDGDGICDNWDAEAGRGYGRRIGRGRGSRFIDEDGDGICDNWDAETGRGYGNGGGNGRGNGCGRNCWR